MTGRVFPACIFSLKEVLPADFMQLSLEPNLNYQTRRALIKVICSAINRSTNNKILNLKRTKWDFVVKTWELSLVFVYSVVVIFEENVSTPFSSLITY